jgi:hypothetical protein
VLLPILFLANRAPAETAFRNMMLSLQAGNQAEPVRVERPIMPVV